MKQIKAIVLSLVLSFVILFSFGCNIHAKTIDAISVSLAQQETTDLSKIRYVVTITGCNKEDVDSYDVTLAIDDASGSPAFNETTRTYHDVYRGVVGVNETPVDNICYVVFTLSDINSFSGYRIKAYFTIHVNGNSYTTDTKYYEIGTKSSISDLSITRNSAANIDISFTPYSGATNASDYTIEYRKEGTNVFTALSINPLSLNGSKLSGEITHLNSTEKIPAGNYYYRVSTLIDGVKHTSEEVMVNACDLVPFVDSLIEETDSYTPAWNQEGFKDKWHYIDGVFLNSIVQLSDQLEDDSYKDFMIKYINYYLTENGEFRKASTKTTKDAYATSELDSVCESRILFDALDYTSNSTRYETPITYTYTNLINMTRCSGSTNFNHKSKYTNQIWLDGMYMYGPFYARYAKYYNKSDIFDELTGQYTYIYNHMRDSETGLYYHANDTTKSVFWCNSETGNSPNFWLRSMGWYVASLADVLDYYPEGANKETLKGYLSGAIEALMKFRDEDSKMFYQIINGDDTLSASKNGVTYYNYLESSGSSLIAYATMKAANMGYMDSSYLAKGIEIFEGVYSHSFDPKTNSLNDICIAAGLDTSSSGSRDGSVFYYLSEERGSNDAKGIGPFIMAYLQYREALGMKKEEAAEDTTMYTVSYQMNGANESYSDEEYQSGAKLSLKTPTKTGYSFGGWYSDSEFKAQVTNQTIVNENMTLYAKWTKAEESSKVYITLNSFSTGDISSATTVSGVTLTPKSGKSSSVVSTNTTLDGQSVTRYFSVGGGGSYSELSIQFTTTKKANIIVYYANSTGRKVALYNSSGLVATSTTTTNGATPVSDTFENIEAGNYAVCSSGSGLHIYMIVIEYV